MESISGQETEHADEWLAKHMIKFTARRTKANNCPRWDSPGCVHGDEYNVVFSRKGRPSLRLKFWNSQHDAQNGVEPRAYDVLCCLTKSDPGTFGEFCREFGYDIDSRKGHSTWRACCREWARVKAFFMADELEELHLFV